MSLNANTVTVDNSGNQQFPAEQEEPAATEFIYLVASGPVILQGQPGSNVSGATLPANVVCPVSGKGGYLRAPSTPVQVSYYYQTNTGG